MEYGVRGDAWLQIGTRFAPDKSCRALNAPETAEMQDTGPETPPPQNKPLVNPPKTPCQPPTPPHKPPPPSPPLPHLSQASLPFVRCRVG